MNITVSLPVCQSASLAYGWDYHLVCHSVTVIEESKETLLAPVCIGLLLFAIVTGRQIHQHGEYLIAIWLGMAAMRRCQDMRGQQKGARNPVFLKGQGDSKAVEDDDWLGRTNRAPRGA